MISFVFHAALVMVLFYFAARSGILGNQLKKITIQMVKEKPPPKPKPPPPPKIQPPRETPKVAAAPKPVEEAKAAPPPVAAPPTVAPPATVLPSFDFGGGRAVASTSDPVQLYKGSMEYLYRSKWDRPDNMDDAKYVAEIRVTVDRNGDLTDPVWLEGSGNAIWDASVRKAVAAVKSMDSPPPTNFPPDVTIRFDVQDESETLLQ